MPNYYRTKILTSIKSLDEVSLVLKKGVDIIDFKDPSHGALGEIPTNKISFLFCKLNFDIFQDIDGLFGDHYYPHFPTPRQIIFSSLICG